jgi:hypothetical protein
MPATIGGTTVFKAVEKVIAKAKRIAAHALEANVDDISFDNGRFTVGGTDHGIDFPEVVKIAFNPAQLPPDIEIGLFETATWSPDSGNIPNSCHICEVELDPETGVIRLDRYTAVHDVGTELNPMLVDGQVLGGIAQAAGQALMEAIVYEEGSGQMLSGSFMDYAMPHADLFPHIAIDRNPVPTKTNPLGVKGAGECGTVGALLLCRWIDRKRFFAIAILFVLAIPVVGSVGYFGVTSQPALMIAAFFAGFLVLGIVPAWPEVRAVVQTTPAPAMATRTAAPFSVFRISKSP